MTKRADMIGKEFGLLTVVSEYDKVRKKIRWLCRCACGSEKPIRGGDLRRGHTTSCGCRPSTLFVNRIAHGNRTHGMSRTPIYRVWRGMVERCHLPVHHSFPRYGARGITVCERWHDFANFYEDFGKLRPSREFTIDRVDNALSYTPDNVRWATQTEQANNRRSNTFVEHDGRRLTLAEWSRESGLAGRCIKQRIATGWPVHLALTVPVGGARPRPA